MADPSDLLGSLLQELGSGGIGEIARATGVNGTDVTNVLVGAMPAILAGLTRNTSSDAGAASLLGALDRDHDGSVLDDVVGFLGAGGEVGEGAGILGHVLGGRQSNVESAISRSTGVDLSTVAQIMAMVAPLIMGALGKAHRQQGFDTSGLAEALGRQHHAARQVSPSAMDVFSKMLDSDGDGDPMDDIVKMGSELLGGLLKQ